MTDELRLQKFLEGLDKLTNKYAIAICGCGCCDSPYLNDLKSLKNSSIDNIGNLTYTDFGYHAIGCNEEARDLIRRIERE